MTTLEAIYENGIFKPVSRVPATLKEYERVKLTIETEKEGHAESFSVYDEILSGMLADGMITHIPKGITDNEDDFEPVQMKGKPISETLIEDRN